MSRMEEQPAQEEEDGPPPPRYPGFAYPLAGLLFAAVLVWSFSRVLLAVDKDQAAALALLMALNILIASALVAYGRRVRRRPVAFPLLLMAAVALVAVGVVSAFAFGDRPPEKVAVGGGPPPPGQDVTLVAKGVAYDQNHLMFTAGADVTMTFENQDAGIPHNFVLFGGPDASAPPLFTGTVVTGPTTTTYTFKAPGPGTYFFHCEIHPIPAMSGTATVGPPSGGGGQPPGQSSVPPPGPLSISAKNIAFSSTELHAPGAGQVTIHFDNQDASVPHNIAIFKGQDATGERIFTGDLVTGPNAVDYTLPAPPPGTYFFHCDVHPTQMFGTITFG